MHGAEGSIAIVVFFGYLFVSKKSGHEFFVPVHGAEGSIAIVALSVCFFIKKICL